ncbi:MAG: DUF1622 domain-containing protein [Longimicrobiales bacterium]
MEEALKGWADLVVMFLGAAAVLLIAIGAIEALWRTAAGGLRATLHTKKFVWVHFARWLMLGLEFQLAADILTTAIEPSWDDVGKLAAIAGIRTFLGFFLERDMASAAKYEDTATHQAPEPQEP